MSLWNASVSPEDSPLKGLEFKFGTEAEIEEFERAVKEKQANCKHEDVIRFGPSYMQMPWGHLRYSDFYFCKNCTLQSDIPIGEYAL